MSLVLQLKQMEVQLEEEYEEKQKVLREKRELESKLGLLSDQVSQHSCGQALNRDHRTGTTTEPFLVGLVADIVHPKIISALPRLEGLWE